MTFNCKFTLKQHLQVYHHKYSYFCKLMQIFQASKPSLRGWGGGIGLFFLQYGKNRQDSFYMSQH